MAKHKYEIEAFGQKFTRTTERTYLFAVAGVIPAGWSLDDRNLGAVVVTWHGTRALADKEAQRKRTRRIPWAAVVVAVPQPERGDK